MSRRWRSVSGVGVLTMLSVSPVAAAPGVAAPAAPAATADAAYSTFYGGTMFDEVTDVAVDRAGHVYVTGRTFSADLPTTAGAFDPAPGGNGDAFVAKLSPDGSALEYATYLGGGGQDEGRGIAVDWAGRAYVTGTTASGDFPTTRGAVGPSLAGFADAFVTRLSPDGRQLDYSTFLGGVSLDRSNAVAADGQGRAHVTGFTYSPNFPVTEGAFDTSFDGGEAFVAQLGPDGTRLGYATFLGGEPESPGISDDEIGRAIAVARDGGATVAGSTRSADFPTTPGAFDRTLGGGGDAFVTRLSRDGSALAYSTFLGGSSVDDAAGLAVDGRGRAHVTGFTESADFPTTAGALDRSVDDFYGDAFVAALSRDGSRVLHGTYLGGGGGEFGLDVAVGHGGEVYASGYTNSIDFPTTPGGVPSPRGGNDAFVVRLDRRLSRLASSTIVGGSRDDLGSGLALGRPRVAYVAGQTWSPDFPTTPGALRPAPAGDADGFVTTVG